MRTFFCSLCVTILFVVKHCLNNFPRTARNYWSPQPNWASWPQGCVQPALLHTKTLYPSQFTDPPASLRVTSIFLLLLFSSPPSMQCPTSFWIYEFPSEYGLSNITLLLGISENAISFWNLLCWSKYFFPFKPII